MRTVRLFFLSFCLLLSFFASSLAAQNTLTHPNTLEAIKMSLNTLSLTPPPVMLLLYSLLASLFLAVQSADLQDWSKIKAKVHELSRQDRLYARMSPFEQAMEAKRLLVLEETLRSKTVSFRDTEAEIEAFRDLLGESDFSFLEEEDQEQEHGEAAEIVPNHPLELRDTVKRFILAGILTLLLKILFTIYLRLD